MRKMIIVAVLALSALLSAFAAPQAQAQSYPDVSKDTPFTQPANFMSLPGLLRYRHLLASGRWISREEAVNAARQQGANVGPAPTG